MTAKTIVVTALLYLTNTVGTPAMPCSTWRSLDGSTTLQFLNESQTELSLTFGENIVRCGNMIAAMDTTALWATCDHVDDAFFPLFWAPTDPTDPASDAILIFGSQPFYSACN